MLYEEIELVVLREFKVNRTLETKSVICYTAYKCGNGYQLTGVLVML